MAFGLIALASLIFAIRFYSLAGLHESSIGVSVLPFYLIWLMSLGAIGSVAFIGMNALSVQEDITFDLTNSRLILMRIALGALFGLVLSLPFGFDGFLEFCKAIVLGKPLQPTGASDSTQQTVTIQAMILVLPFILGFSTSLVILILNRLVDGVQGFFGRRDSQAAAASASPVSRSQAPATGVARPLLGS